MRGHRWAASGLARPILAGFAVGVALLASAGCAHHGSPGATGAASSAHGVLDAPQRAFLDTLEHRTFGFFWDLSDGRNGLTPDRWPTRSFVSVSAVGFALTAYPIGVERGYITRQQASERVRNTLRFFWTAPQDSSRSGATGYHGFFYHFLDPSTGLRFGDVELSTVDTALLLAGALFCRGYFDRDDPVETEIRRLAESLNARVDWRWAQARPPTIVLGWTPEAGFLPYDWRGYNETMLVHIMALGSPTHAVTPATWTAWTRDYKWGSFHGQEYLGFAPLFGHQYSLVWLDLRGVQDDFMRGKGIDYFENSRRATLAQRSYAIANPEGFAGYGERLWGLSACDGPLNGTVMLAGRERELHTYEARGACFTRVSDDGTVTPTAAGGSIAFAPEVVLPVLMAMRADHGSALFSTYGFLDALNPSLVRDTTVQHGHVVPGHGWYDGDYLGIDQGPILAMAENLRSELVWRTMRRDPTLVRGLRAAGFRGGWLDSSTVGR